MNPYIMHTLYPIYRRKRHPDEVFKGLRKLHATAGPSNKYRVEHATDVFMSNHMLTLTLAGSIELSKGQRKWCSIFLMLLKDS